MFDEYASRLLTVAFACLWSSGALAQTSRPAIADAPTPAWIYESANSIEWAEVVSAGESAPCVLVADDQGNLEILDLATGESGMREDWPVRPGVRLAGQWAGVVVLFDRTTLFAIENGSRAVHRPVWAPSWSYEASVAAAGHERDDPEHRADFRLAAVADRTILLARTDGRATLHDVHVAFGGKALAELPVGVRSSTVVLPCGRQFALMDERGDVASLVFLNCDEREEVSVSNPIHVRPAVGPPGARMRPTRRGVIVAEPDQLFLAEPDGKKMLLDAADAKLTPPLRLIPDMNAPPRFADDTRPPISVFATDAAGALIHVDPQAMAARLLWRPPDNPDSPIQWRAAAALAPETAALDSSAGACVIRVGETLRGNWLANGGAQTEATGYDDESLNIVCSSRRHAAPLNQRSILTYAASTDALAAALPFPPRERCAPTHAFSVPFAGHLNRVLCIRDRLLVVDQHTVRVYSVD